VARKALHHRAGGKENPSGDGNLSKKQSSKLRTTSLGTVTRCALWWAALDEALRWQSTMPAPDDRTGKRGVREEQDDKQKLDTAMDLPLLRVARSTGPKVAKKERGRMRDQRTAIIMAHQEKEIPEPKDGDQNLVGWIKGLKARYRNLIAILDFH
jgi:hypothetical protein